MDTKQFNLKLPVRLAKVAEEFVRNYGYRNIQDLAIDGIREKVYGKFDDDFSEEEINLVEQLIQVETKRKNIVSENELNQVLLE